MRDNWTICTSKDHEGRKVYINLDRVDLIYENEPGTTHIAFAGWEGDEILHVEETPEVLLGQAQPK